MTSKNQRVREAYDRVAPRYADQFTNELKHKPLDRALLGAFAEEVRGGGTIADIGCGPGHVAAYLHALGLPVVGIDLSEEMVVHARRAAAGVEFRRDDMLNLSVEPRSLGGIVAFYSIVHLEPDEVAVAAREFYRVLRPAGRLLLSFHEGDERIRLQEWLGQTVDVEWIFFSLDFVERQLQAAGFVLDASIRRAPYTPFEHPSKRAYVSAHKPPDEGT
jgi:SAM-dependent methyltransferase